MVVVNMCRIDGPRGGNYFQGEPVRENYCRNEREKGQVW